MAALLVLSVPTFVLANLVILSALRVNWALGAQLFDYTGETSPGWSPDSGPGWPIGCSTWCCRR